jgi:hypothetical protein
MRRRPSSNSDGATSEPCPPDSRHSSYGPALHLRSSYSTVGAIRVARMASIWLVDLPARQLMSAGVREVAVPPYRLASRRLPLSLIGWILPRALSDLVGRHVTHSGHGSARRARGDDAARGGRRLRGIHVPGVAMAQRISPAVYVTVAVFRPFRRAAKIPRVSQLWRRDADRRGPGTMWRPLRRLGRCGVMRGSAVTGARTPCKSLR